MKKSLIAVIALLLAFTSCGTVREDIQTADEQTTEKFSVNETEPEITEAERQEEIIESATEEETEY